MSEPSGMFFELMISGLIPMAVFTFIAAAWGMKLKEWKQAEQAEDGKPPEDPSPPH